MAEAGFTTSPEAGAVVLAAGAATRFGAVKQLAPLRGRPLLEHTLEAVRAVPAIERRVVVLGAHAEAVGGRVDMAGLEVVVCEEWQEGLAASLRAGVAALAGARRVVVLLGDMPGITVQVIAGALDHLDDRFCDAVRTLHNGRPTHPVVLGPRALARVADLRGDVGARDLLATIRVREWEAGRLFDATDIDEPGQLRVYAARHDLP